MMSMYRSWAWQEAAAHSWFKRPLQKRWRTCVCKVRLYAWFVRMSQNVGSRASAAMKCAFGCAFESKIHTPNIYACMNVSMHPCLYAAFRSFLCTHGAYVWRLSVQCVVVFTTHSIVYPKTLPPPHTQKHSFVHTHTNPFLPSRLNPLS